MQIPGLLSREISMRTMFSGIVRSVAAAAVFTTVSLGGGCGSAPKKSELSPVKVEAPDAGTVFWQVGNFYIAGQPTAKGFEAMKGRGGRTVVNLRPAEEQKDFDEKKAVEGLGLGYVSIPVTPQILSDAKGDEFIAALKDAKKPVLIHCASANRASALWAVYLGTNYGLPPDEAIGLAETSGLKSGDLKSFVKGYLERTREARGGPSKAEKEASP